MFVRWPHQEYARVEVPRRILAGERRICLTSPTGGGKTVMIHDLVEWGLAQGYKAVVYTNRKLLTHQLARGMDAAGIRYGVRASGWDDRRELDVQISMIPTEAARVFADKVWEAHGSGQRTLGIIDEAHLNAGETAQRLAQKHLDDGGVIVGPTATPIGIGHMYDSLVIAGTASELRRCGALVPVYHYGPDEPDMRGFKQNVKTGEFTEGDVVKAIMHKQVFARVVEYYWRLNHDQRPTILFAPGVKESIWFAEQFAKAGVRSAHIDGEGVWLDGEYQRGGDRERLLEMLAYGEIKLLCNRFVLREGLDVPIVSHIITATVMGSLRTLLQSVGRGMRASAKKPRATWQDHGGHWHRHGSVNADRAWSLNLTEKSIRDSRMESLRDKPLDGTPPKTPEPIHCPKCSMIRAGGAVCPQCGYETTKHSRMVIQQDGSLREHVGDIYKPIRVKSEPDTADLWVKTYWQFRNSGKTFAAARGYFHHQHGYRPPEDLPMMPLNNADWHLPIKDVSMDRLNGYCNSCRRCVCKCAPADSGLFVEADA